MKRLQCEKCDIAASASWAWLWYPHRVPAGVGVASGRRARELWLCPDCAGEFSSDRARNAFLERASKGEPSAGGR